MRIAKKILLEHRAQLLEQIADECRHSATSLEHLALRTEWAIDKDKANFNSLGELQGISGHIDVLTGQVTMIDEVLELLDVVLERPDSTKGDR